MTLDFATLVDDGGMQVGTRQYGGGHYGGGHYGVIFLKGWKLRRRTRRRNRPYFFYCCLHFELIVTLLTKHIYMANNQL